MSFDRRAGAADPDPDPPDEDAERAISQAEPLSASQYAARTCGRAIDSAERSRNSTSFARITDSLGVELAEVPNSLTASFQHNRGIRGEPRRWDDESPLRPLAARYAPRRLGLPCS